MNGSPDEQGTLYEILKIFLVPTAELVRGFPIGRALGSQRTSESPSTKLTLDLLCDFTVPPWNYTTTVSA